MMDESELERRRLERMNALFLALLNAQRKHPDDYDGWDDFAKSIDEAYRVIRERKAAGGKGWEPP